MKPRQCFQTVSRAVGAGLILVTTGLLLACGATPTPPPATPAAEAEVAAVPSPTATVAPSPTPSPSATAAPSPTPSPSPTTAASPTPVPTVVVTNDSCIACHSSQEQLIATAREEEVVEALSEGEG